MIRLVAGFLLVLFLALAGFAAWMRSDGGAVVALSEAELEAARSSGAGSRAIAVDSAQSLPTMADLDAIARRAEADAAAARLQGAREAATGESRALLTVLLSEAERLRGNIDAAYELAHEGAEALPENSRARYTLSQAIMSRLIAKAEKAGAAALLAELGEARRYLAELDAAVELDPAYQDARVRRIIVRAFARWPLRDTKGAEVDIEALGEHDEFRRDFWRVQLLVADEKRIDEAIAGFEALDARKPGDPDVLYNLGELHAKTDDWRAAAAAFDRAVVEPRTRRAYQALYQAAKAREKGGFELERALELLDEFVAADPVGDLMPAMDRVHYHRGKLLTALGLRPEAREAYERALALAPDDERVEKALAELDATPAGG